jgi:hypothetical protein
MAHWIMYYQCSKFKFRSVGILLKGKQGYTVRKMEKNISGYILVSAGIKFGNKKKFRYSIPAYTSPFRALCIIRNVGIYICVCVNVYVYG